MTVAVTRSRILIPAAIAVVGAIGCASAIRVHEQVEPPQSSASLPGDAAADFASHGDLLLPPERDTAYTVDSPDGLRTIERGTYAGMRVPVRIESALSGPKKSEHFWRVPKAGGENAGVVGWRSTRYPIPVAFRHLSSSRDISADDSAAFWKILSEMNADIGIALFTPATVGDADPEDVIIVDVRTMPASDGFSRSTWSSSGELFDVRVSFGSHGVLHDSRVVAHEMTHALGFGHTKSWASVMNPGEHGTSRLTPADVAYIELAMLLRLRRERVDMRRLIALAVERGTPVMNRDEGHRTCPPEEMSLLSAEPSLRNRALWPVGVLTVVASCNDEATGLRSLRR